MPTDRAKEVGYLLDPANILCCQFRGGGRMTLRRLKLRSGGAKILPEVRLRRVATRGPPSRVLLNVSISYQNPRSTYLYMLS